MSGDEADDLMQLWMLNEAYAESEENLEKEEAEVPKKR
jgi:hypothetical protein